MQPEEGRQARLQVAALPSAPWWAARYATDVLRRWQLSSLDDVVIAVVSEMVAYAVTSRQDGVLVSYGGVRRLRRIVVSLQRTAGGLVVEVWCRSQAAPCAQVDALTDQYVPVLPRVEQYSGRWGYVEPTCGGTTVWAELAAADIT